MKNGTLSLSLQRIERMEEYYDAVSAAVAAGEHFGHGLRYMARALDLYMRSGAWLRDYELDEMGLIPAGMKRGVLSEDGLYSLLRELDGMKTDIK